MRFIITCMLLITYAAYTADTFLFPPYIEVPCYKSQDDRNLKNPPFSTAHIPIGPNLTLHDLQEMIRDLKGTGFLWFGTIKVDAMRQDADRPLSNFIGTVYALETFVDILYFILANAVSPKIGNTKNH